MKIKRLLIYLLVLSMTIPVWGKVTPAQCWKKSLGGNFSLPFAGTSTYRDAVPTGVWTFRDGDLWWDTANDILYAYDGTSSWDPLNATGGAAYLYLSPQQTAAGEAVTTEGTIFYDDQTNNLKYYTTSWQTVGTSTASTLDEAYSAGQSITVDAGALTLTTTDAANNAALAIVHVETGAFPAFTISNAGTDPTIEITTSGTGADITGTSATWSISKVGLGTFGGGLLISTGDVLFDATSASEDVQWDDSAQLMHFLDGAILGLGGAVNAAADMTFESDGTNVLVEVATQDDADLIFGSTDALDIKIHANTATDFLLFDGSGAAIVTTDYDIWLDDTSDVFFGTTKNIGFLLAWDSSKTMSLLAGAASDDFVFNIGTDQAGVDLGLYGATASAKVLWDAGNDQLVVSGGAQITLNDDVEILFGTGASNAGDFKLYGSGTGPVLYLDVISAGSGSIEIGNDADDVPLKWHCEDTGGHWLFTGNQLRGVGAAQLSVNDDVEILIGTGATSAGDFSIVGTSAPKLVIDVISPGSGEIEIGNDADDVPLTWYGETTGNYIRFTGDQLQVEGSASGAQIALGDGDAILFGDTLGTGDFSISDESDILVITQVSDGVGAVAFSADGEGMDIKMYANTAGNYLHLDESAEMWINVGMFTKYDDDAVILIGTKTNVTTADGDFEIESISDTRMNINAVVADSQVCIGDGTVRSDFLIDNATNAAADVWFDSSGDTNAEVFHFGGDKKRVDTIWYGDVANKLVKWDMSADDWMFGADGEEVDVWFYGAETSDFIQWDGDKNTYGALIFEDSTLNMMDDTAINLGDSRNIVMDWDSTNEYAEIKGPVQYGYTTLCLFDHIPTFSGWQPAATGFTWGGAATGSTGDENVMRFRDATFIYHVLGTQTELGPQMRVGSAATGSFDISCDDTETDGLEICGAEPLVGGGKDNFVVGTAFYLKAKIYLTDVSGVDDFWVGFRNVEAFQTGIDGYNTMAAIGLNADAGDFYTHTELDGANMTETDVTDAGGDWGDTEAHTLEVYVAANGAVTYKIDGDEPTGVVGFTWTASDVVVPFIFFVHSGDFAELTYAQRWECGYQ